MKKLLFSLFAITVIESSGTVSPVNIYVFSGQPQTWTEIVPSTPTVAASTVTCPSVALSSCAIVQVDALDCYYPCINGNGTLGNGPSAPWVKCP
jgi:uncharacterized Fe-S cluster protein YjdI